MTTNWVSDDKLVLNLFSNNKRMVLNSTVNHSVRIVRFQSRISAYVCMVDGDSDEFQHADPVGEEEGLFVTISS